MRLGEQDIMDVLLWHERNFLPRVLAMRSRITRLDALRSETIKEMIQLSEKTERAMSRFLPSAYKDFYYRELYEIGKTRGIRSAAGAVDGKRIEAVLRMPWSGKNYSERIWHNNAKLGETIQKSIVAAAHRGVPVSDMVRDVKDRMGVGTSDATRLVRTELNYVQNQAALDSIKDAGMTYYRFIATLDNRTSPMCRSKDGEVFPVEDAEPGTNMPPLHPRCRSIISGSLYAEHKPRTGMRIARDEYGKNVFVPAGMRYEDWKKKYIDAPRPSIQDVTKEYIERAKPRKGIVSYEGGYNRSEHKAEIDAAKWLYKTFGGSVTLLQEINADKKKTPDILWDGAFWDLKTISTERAADSAIRHGLKQIEENPGGLVLDFVSEHLDLEELTAVINRCLYRSAKSSMDIIVSAKEKLITVLRYDIKKKRKPPRQ